MVLVIGENSAWQRTLLVEKLHIDEVNRIKEVRSFASGKGVNVVRALLSTGFNAHVIGYAGGFTGKKFSSYLQEEKLPASFIKIKHETRICSTIIEDDEKVTELVEPAPEITRQESAAFLELYEEKLEKVDTVVISGTAVKGEAALRYRDIAEKAGQKNIPVIIDSFSLQARKALDSAFEVLKINLSEFEELTGRRLAAYPDRVKAYVSFKKEHSINWLIITMGAKGAEGYDGREIVKSVPVPVSVRNTIGSGDSFSAGVAQAILKKEGIEKAVKRGTAMGTANCLNYTPGIVKKEEYLEILKKTEISVTGI